MTKNALLYGRRPAIGTSFGVTTGLLIWTVASALGVAAIVHASEALFTAMKLIGGAYLIWLGIQALRAAGRKKDTDEVAVAANGTRGLDGKRGFRQGLHQRSRQPQDRRLLHEPLAAVHQSRPAGADALPDPRVALRRDDARMARRLRA